MVSVIRCKTGQNGTNIVIAVVIGLKLLHHGFLLCTGSMCKFPLIHMI